MTSHDHNSPDKHACCHGNQSSQQPQRPQLYQDANATYTCPMHPEIVQLGPGNCPICGMSLEPLMVTQTSQPNAELIDMTRRFWIAVLLSLPISVLSMGNVMPGLQAILATPVIFWCGWPLMTRGWQSFLTRNLNMFSLIALGTLIAYAYSVIGLLLPDLFPAAFKTPMGEVHLYFEAAAAIITLVLLGQVMEIRGREKTGTALRALLNLAPKVARRIKANQGEEDVPLHEVHKNDLLRVKPGEAIPVDGVVIEGYSAIDESMVTGESMPVEKSVDAKVIGGTMNVSGSFIMRAEHVGAETMLAQIVQQVAAAQRSRAPIQRLADAIAAYFVPAVLLVAVITFIVWSLVGPAPAMTYGLISAISVLIIACPCALGLATPMSIMVGMGRGAQAGILIKDAESLERFEKVDTLVIDKTGTLTAGKPSLSSIVTYGQYSEVDLLQMAASLEASSEHPLANAIMSAARDKHIALIKPSAFHAEIGKGITGIIQGKRVALGNTKLIEQLGLDADSVANQSEELRRNGETVMFVVVENELAGIISVADPLKATTLDALQALRDEHINIVMVTGDNRVTAEAIAKQLGITSIEADVLPQQKTDIIKRLRQQGHLVAMAGDGINDAAALAESDIGIAMGTGTDIAMQSANITLVKGDLMGIVRARKLSKKVMGNIRQNLFLAFAYNILCIPIAAGILYPWTGLLLSPIVASAAMSLSSVSVITNAFRLRRVTL